MRPVGIKELKNRLSHYLRLVRRGARFVVTDHGRPVAELGPTATGSPRLGEAWERAAAEGWITMPRPGRFPLRKPVRLKGGASVSDAIIEDRG
jgi:prevent-host-death family protein